MMQPNFIRYQLNDGVHMVRERQLVVAHMADTKRAKRIVSVDFPCIIRKESRWMSVGFFHFKLNNLKKYQGKDDTKVFVWIGKQVVLSLIEKDTFKSCFAQQVGDVRSH